MIQSKVKYINSIDELSELEFDMDTDYILPGVFPIDFSIMKGLLNVELKDSTLLDNAYIEFESLDLSGRQILNLCNNLNINILIKNVTDEQLDSMLKNYARMDMRKTVYPTKTIVLLTLYLLYLRQFKNYDFFKTFDEDVKYIYDNFISYTYIEGKYSLDFIKDWVKKFFLYLIENEKEFIANFKQHCLYLFEVTYNYYKGIDFKAENVTQSNIRSGIAVPLAYVMRDLKFDIFKIDFLNVPKVTYNYLPNLFKKDVIKALASTIDYTLAAENYLNVDSKDDLFIDDLSTLTKEDVITALKNKKRIIAKKTESTVDLFPLEIIKRE
jgi:hypothetical protein